MECGECTLCCDLFPVAWLNKPALEVCKHVCESGCAVHETKPQECSGFDCAYAQHEVAPIELRPDHCNVVFEKINNTLFYGTQVPGKALTKFALGQIMTFNKQNYSVIIMEPGTEGPKLFVADTHNEQKVKLQFNNHLKKRYGRSHV